MGWKCQTGGLLHLISPRWNVLRQWLCLTGKIVKGLLRFHKYRITNWYIQCPELQKDKLGNGSSLSIASGAGSH